MRARTGFTLIELLVVVAIIAILVAILLPVLSGVREGARRSACQSNLRQLGQAALLYARDYNERLPGAWDAGGHTASGPGGWMYFADRAADGKPGQFLPDQGTLYEYVGSKSQIYQCPDDEMAAQSHNSYAINSRVGRPAGITNGTATYYRGAKLSSIQDTAGMFLFIEEGMEQQDPRQPSLMDTTDDSYFNAAWQSGGQWLHNVPARRHAKGFNLVFCDGHVEYLRYETFPRDLIYGPEWK